MQKCIGVKNELHDWMQDERGCVGGDGGESRPNEIINRRKSRQVVQFRTSIFNCFSEEGGGWFGQWVV